MSIEEIQDEPTESTDVEVDTQGHDESDDNDEGEGTATTATEPEFAAWNLKKPESKQPTHIPYDRFRDVNEERKAFFERTQTLESENAQLRQRQAELEKVPDPDDVKLEDYDNPQDYLKARDAAVVRKARAEFEASLVEREQQANSQKILNEMGANYSKNIETAAAANPNVAKAAAFFDEYAELLHPAIAHEMMIDPNIGEVMVKICTDQTLLQQVFRGNPADTARLLHRLSAKLEAQREAGAPAPDRTESPSRSQVPAAIDLKANIRSALPAQVKLTGSPNGAAVNLYKHAGKMSMAEYRRARTGKS